MNSTQNNSNYLAKSLLHWGIGLYRGKGGKWVVTGEKRIGKSNVFCLLSFEQTMRVQSSIRGEFEGEKKYIEKYW